MVSVETETMLNVRISAIFDGSGIANGMITVGPNQRWVVRLFNTNSDSANQTHCTIYRGSVGGTQLDFTRTGNGDSSNTTVDLRQNEMISVQWEGGTPGATANLDIEGTVYQKGRRAY